MKKIQSKQEAKIKKDKTQMILAILLLGVLGFGTIGFAFLNRLGTGEQANIEKVSFYGQTFYNAGSYWTNGEIVLLNNPLKIDFEIISELDINEFFEQPLYIYSPEMEARAVIAQNLRQVALRISEACPSIEMECYQRDIPVRDCSNNFIIIEFESEEKIERIDNCFYIKTPEEDIGKITDKFILNLFIV